MVTDTRNRIGERSISPPMVRAQVATGALAVFVNDAITGAPLAGALVRLAPDSDPTRLSLSSGFAATVNANGLAAFPAIAEGPRAWWVTFAGYEDVTGETTIVAGTSRGVFVRPTPISAAPAPTTTTTSTYTVVAGDTLSAIAGRFGVTLNALLAANPQITNPDLIFVGQVIQIPGGDVEPAPTPTPTPPPTPTPTGTYTVVAGDTLSAIAARFGVTLNQLLAANPQITNPDLIFVGQVINIPGGAGDGAPPPAPAPTTGNLVFIVSDAATGAAVASALVSFAGRAVRTDSRGFAALVDVPEGTQSYTIGASGFAGATGQATVVGGASRTELVGMTSLVQPPAAGTASLTLIVTDAATGAPLQFANARAAKVGTLGSSGASSDALGRATFPELEVGVDYVLTVVLVRYDGATQPLRLNTAGEHTIDVPLLLSGTVPPPTGGAVTTLTLTVTDAATAAPLPGATAILFAIGPTLATRIAERNADAQGVAFFEQVPVGIDLDARVSADGYASTTASLRLDDVEPPGVLDVALELLLPGQQPPPDGAIPPPAAGEPGAGGNMIVVLAVLGGLGLVTVAALAGREEA